MSNETLYAQFMSRFHGDSDKWDALQLANSHADWLDTSEGISIAQTLLTYLECEFDAFDFVLVHWLNRAHNLPAVIPFAQEKEPAKCWLIRLQHIKDQELIDCLHKLNQHEYGQYLPLEPQSAFFRQWLLACIKQGVKVSPIKPWYEVFVKDCEDCANPYEAIRLLTDDGCAPQFLDALVHEGLDISGMDEALAWCESIHDCAENRAYFNSHGFGNYFPSNLRMNPLGNALSDGNFALMRQLLEKGMDPSKTVALIGNRAKDLQGFYDFLKQLPNPNCKHSDKLQSNSAQFDAHFNLSIARSIALEFLA